MKRRIFITMIILMTLLSCNGQTKKDEEKSIKNLPQTNIKVNKEYDNNGNLIRYDSTYSSYYSNVKGDSVLQDSIFNSFTNQFNQSYFFSNHPYFEDFFFQDSLLIFDFYKKDFFYNRFKNNMERMDSLFREMDIMKNNFFRKHTIPSY